MDSILLGILVAQIGQILRTWMTTRKATKQYSVLEKKIDVMGEKLEHTSFIPEFEIKIDSYVNSIFSGFTFKNENTRYLARSIGKASKYIFTNIVKIGFNKFDLNSLLDDFSMQDMKTRSIISTQELNLKESELFELLESERESFLIKIKEVIKTYSNGDRQEKYTHICKEYILAVVKGIKNL